MYNGFNDFSLTNIITWLALGLLVGLIIHLIDRGSVRGGVLATIITGVVGALVGGFLSNIFFGLGVSGFNIQSILIAVAGALLITVVQRLIFRKTGHIKTTTERID